ncbi:hypothetical protein HPL003_17335 [Paenibacillus terrae HPL-003]|uniref:Uncharacterized protein n=1 Tax=Paenibacillus terrae (strain HPL-003) TaxID=985665 RepID=G7VZB7_PAETH|nr:hypothetical protein HPL003_17335 [Paenibacillus terrae HPL-003]
MLAKTFCNVWVALLNSERQCSFAVDATWETNG